MMPMMIATWYILVWICIAFEISTVCLTIKFLRSFLLNLPYFYPVILGVEGFRCIWSHSMTHTYARTHPRSQTQILSLFLGWTLVDEGFAFHRDPYLNSTQRWLETDINAAGGIGTRNLSELAAADPRLRPHGHWNLPIEFHVSNFTNENPFWGSREINIYSYKSLSCFNFVNAGSKRHSCPTRRPSASNVISCSRTRM